MKSTTAPPVAATLGTLADIELDRKIRDRAKMISVALADCDRALEMVKMCERSAILSAWRLGQLLIEKKDRLAHGSWLPWLDSCGISPSSASDYTRIARQIASAGNLGSSIRATLRALPEPTTATPKSVPVIVPVAVKVVKPTTATPKAVAVKIVKPDLGIEPDAETISALEKELYGEREKVADLEERNSIMEEAADPEIRATADTINNQRELIKTLKASVAKWQSKHADARRENGALKRRIRALENQKGARAI